MAPDPNLLRAARLLLGLSQDELAETAHISKRSLSRLEAGEHDVALSTIEVTRLALEAQGIVFLGETETSGPGLRVDKQLSSSWSEKRARFALARKKKLDP